MFLNAEGPPGAKPSREMTQTAKNECRKSDKQPLINMKTAYFHFMYGEVLGLLLSQMTHSTNSAHILCPRKSCLKAGLPLKRIRYGDHIKIRANSNSGTS